MEVKEQVEEIIEPSDIRRILNEYYFGSDIDREMDMMGLCAHLSQELNKHIAIARVNDECNAVLALKQIQSFMSKSSKNYDDAELGIMTKELCINDIIKQTVGELK